MKRANLGQFEGKMVALAGVFEGRSGYWQKGQLIPAVLIRHLHHSTGAFLCDHVWVTVSNKPPDVDLEQGDEVWFKTRVKRYDHGFCLVGFYRVRKGET